MKARLKKGAHVVSLKYPPRVGVIVGVFKSPPDYRVAWESGLIGWTIARNVKALRCAICHRGWHKDDPIEAQPTLLQAMEFHDRFAHPRCVLSLNAEVQAVRHPDVKRQRTSTLRTRTHSQLRHLKKGGDS